MTNTKFNTPKENHSFFEMQEEVLAFWEKNNIFERSISERPETNTYSFYDGPPFITGTPHYATLLPSIAKDIIPRFKTMKGYRVPRLWGWDCHGLPAETKVEKKLELRSKRDIEELGIGKFIDACREYVSEVSSEWPWYIQHIGRWADMKNAYKTMDLTYMESVIHVFKDLYEKDFIYKGTRSSLYCTRCTTPLSKFEITMDDGFYRDVQDQSVAIKFKLTDRQTYLLAWTTTPWTLPSNAGIAINPEEQYAEVQHENTHYILSEKAVEKFFGTDVSIVKTLQGTELVGLSYEPLYTFFPSKPADYKIYPADFVTGDDGTGIVHIAPGFGENDFNLGKEKGLSIFVSVDDEGKCIKELEPWKGVYYKKTNSLIIEDLRARNLLFKEETISHSYPFCYRCETALIYKAQDAWYLNVAKIRDQLIETNKDINWVPPHFKEGRFEYNLKNAPDWCLSRSRYWGSPIPVWECADCGTKQVIGSIAELEQLSKQSVTELHRPDIDRVVLPCTSCTGTAHRVKEVLDCWFESGSMPYAQSHYPFEHKEFFEKNFPSDFIIEYTGQLRGWFYYLHVLSNALKNSISFKNVVVTGVIKGTDGRKMSKSFGNYPDPKLTIEKYGGEALRLYFMSSPIMKGDDLDMREDDIKEQHRKVMLILWNSYKYFVTYANANNWTPNKNQAKSTHILDTWIEGRLETMIQAIDEGLEGYDYPKATRAIRPFVEDFSTWYIRISRDRLASGDTEALQSMYDVLVRFTIAVAPILPFISETMYQNLVRTIDTESPDSVHLCMWSEAKLDVIKNTERVHQKMEELRALSTLAHSIRSEANISLRQPLAKIFVQATHITTDDEYAELLKQEVNAKEIAFEIPADTSAKSADGLSVALDTNLTDELMQEGTQRELVRAIQNFRKEKGLEVEQIIALSYFTEDDSIKHILENKKTEILKIARLSGLEFSNDIGEQSIVKTLYLKL